MLSHHLLSRYKLSSIIASCAFNDMGNTGRRTVLAPNMVKLCQSPRVRVSAERTMLANTVSGQGFTSRSSYATPALNLATCRSPLKPFRVLHELHGNPELKPCVLVNGYTRGQIDGSTVASGKPRRFSIQRSYKVERMNLESSSSRHCRVRSASITSRDFGTISIGQHKRCTKGSAHWPKLRAIILLTF